MNARARTLRLGFEADAWTIVSGAAVAQLAFALLVWLYGESPREMTRLVLEGTWGTPYGAGQVIFKATPLLFTGLAVHVALKAGLFNVGAEGQLALASLATGVVGAALPTSTAALVAIPLLAFVAFITGAAWAAPAAALRATGAHEVISTILLNRVAEALVGLLLGLGLAQKASVRTPDVAPHARLSSLAKFCSKPRRERGEHGLRGGTRARGGRLVGDAEDASRSGGGARCDERRGVSCGAHRRPVASRAGARLVRGHRGPRESRDGPRIQGLLRAGPWSWRGLHGSSRRHSRAGSRRGNRLRGSPLRERSRKAGLAINAYVPAEAMEVIQGIAIVVVALGDERVRRWLTSKRRVLG